MNLEILTSRPFVKLEKNSQLGLTAGSAVVPAAPAPGVASSAGSRPRRSTRFAGRAEVGRSRSCFFGCSGSGSITGAGFEVRSPLAEVGRGGRPDLADFFSSCRRRRRSSRSASLRFSRSSGVSFGFGENLTFQLKINQLNLFAGTALFACIFFFSLVLANLVSCLGVFFLSTFLH